MKIIKSLFSRWVIISLLLLIQIVSFCLITYLFVEEYVWVSIAFEAISLIALMSIIVSEANPNLKIPWLVIILLLPPVGILVYTMFGRGYVSRTQKKLYQSVNDRQASFVNQDEKVLDEIKEIDKKYYSQSKYISNTSKYPIHKNTKVTYLKSGEEYFTQLFSDLKKAKHFIFLEYFILGEGKLLDELISILEEKIKEGIEVRLIYDDIGSIKTLPYNYDKRLTQLGIKCVKFNKYYPLVSVVYNNRDHRKIAVIDGYISYTGGINISDEYANITKRFGHWKDSGVRIYGEGVRNFTLMFLKTYDIFSNTKTNIENYMPHTYHKDEFTCDGFVQPFDDGPAPVFNDYISKTVYMNMINQAVDYIYITTPYLVADHELISSLEDAAKRGVDVRIITPGIPDKKMVYDLTRDSYRTLIKSGVKIYEYEPGFIHAKNIVCDDTVAIVGTINLDYRSLVHHFECGCYMVNCQCIKDIKADFIETLKLSKKPDKKVYVHKNIIKKLWIGFLKFFAPLM